MKPTIVIITDLTDHDLGFRIKRTGQEAPKTRGNHYRAISPEEAARAKMPTQSAKDQDLTGPVPVDSIDKIMDMMGGLE